MIDSRLALLGKTADVPGAVQRHKAGQLNNILGQAKLDQIPIENTRAERVADINQQNADTASTTAGINYQKLINEMGAENTEQLLNESKKVLQVGSQQDWDIYRSTLDADDQAILPKTYGDEDFQNFYRQNEMLVSASLDPEKPDNTLVEIADPDSPTGTRFVPRAEAIGQPGKPGSGMSLTSDGQGGFTLTQGRGNNATQNGLDKATNRKIEGQKFDAVETLARVNKTATTFKPEFLETSTKLSTIWSSAKEKAGVKLNEGEKQELIEYSEFKQAAFADMNLTMNILSGAAVSDQEFARMTQQMPNAGSGIFDGDSPTVFKTKMDAIQRDQKRAIMRYNYALKNNQDPLATGIELADVDALYDRRGAELEGIIKQQNPNISEDVLELEVRSQLKQEFGM